MSEGSIARRYAKALLELAQNAGKIDLYFDELAALQNVLVQSKDLNSVFSDPAFTHQVRKQVLESIVVKFSLSKEVLNFLRLLIDRDRIKLLSEILMSYQDQADEIQNRVRVEVSSPFELSESEENQIKNTLQKILNKQILLNKKHDQSLLGGMLIRVHDVVYDGSLKHALEKIKHQMMEAPLQ